MKKKLPNKWTEYLVDKPETGMGYHIVNIEFENGLIIKRQNVYNSEFIDLSDKSEFVDLDKIVSIEIQSK